MHKKVDIIRLDEKQDATTCCLQETHSKYKNIHMLEIKEWKRKHTPSKTHHQTVGRAVVIADRADFKAKNIISNKEINFIMIKKSITFFKTKCSYRTK